MRNVIWHSLSLVAGVVALAIAGPWLGSALNGGWPHHSLKPAANERLVTLDVGGMSCVGCAAKVQGELTSTAGVSGAEVDLRDQRAYIVCARQLPDSTLLGAVHRAGPSFLASVAPATP